MKQKLLYIILLFFTLAWSGESLAQTTSYVLTQNSSNDGEMWELTTSSPIALSGPGDEMIFEACKARGGIDGLYVEFSENGSSWFDSGQGEINVPANERKSVGFLQYETVWKWKEFRISINNLNVRHVRFRLKTGSTLNKYWRNVRVTRATTLAVSSSSPDFAFGTIHRGNNKTIKAKVDWNNTTYNQNLTGSGPAGYSVTTTSMGEYGTGKEIPVKFSASSSTALGAHNGNITLSMNGKTVTIPATANVVTTYYGQAKAQASVGGSAAVSFTSYAAAAAASTTSDDANTANTTAAKGSKTAYYKATVTNGYRFLGWIKGTDSYSANNVVSTALEYSPTIEYSSETSGSPTVTTYKAWFAPQFHFSATATPSNASFGTATASVASTVEGNPEQASVSTTATFTATPATGCTFNGWYGNDEFSGTPVSMKADNYEVELNNNTPGSTTTKKLYAKFKKNPALQWANPGLDLNLISGTTVSSAATGVDDGLNITYTSSNTDALTIDEDGTIHAVGLGTSTVTATVAADETYNADEITREFSVGEKKQATFTPAWWTESEQLTATNIKVGATTTIALTNVATDATFTVSANPTGIISWTREGNTLTINGDVAGTTELTLSQTGNTFLNGNTATYTITVSRYPNTFAVAAEKQTMKVGEVWENVVTNIGNNNTSVSYSTEGIATYDATTKSITAVGEGSTTITFTQDATATHAAATKYIVVTVTKVTNTLAVSLPTQAVNVGGTIALSITGQNNADAIVGTITDTQLSSSVNNGTDVITYANGIITACNAGTAKITFSQPATAQYTAYTSDTYEITVNKIHNAITITNLNGGTATNTTMKYNEAASLTYTSINTDTSPVITRISGSFTTYSAGTITSGNSAGTDIYEITQAETYKYEAGYASFTVRVNNTDEGVGYVLYEEKEYSHGTGSGIAHTYSWSGPGETLYYKACRGTAITIYYNLYVEWSADNQNWTECQNNTSLDPDYKNDFFSCPIPENARYVRFRFPGGGTLVKYIKDVRITRKTYLEVSSDKTELGDTYTDETKTATFNIDYSSVNGGNISISSNNPNFVPSISSVSVPTNKTATDNSAGKNTTYITGIDSKQAFTVTYTPNPDQLGDESAVITISDLFYSKQITLTATAKKYPTTIQRGINEVTETTVDDVIDNAFAFTGTSATYPSSDSNDDFFYTISHTQTSGVNNGSGVISYDPATNTVTGLNQGTARLTIYQKKTDLYNATSQTFDFTVSKLENNTIMTLSTKTLNVDGTANVELMNADSDGALSATYSNISYLNESQNREGGLLTFAGNTLTGCNAGTGTVTITQAETYKYVAKSQSFDVTVNKLPQTLTWDNPDLETTMQVGSTLEGNTAASDAGLTPVTYSSGNTAAITVDANTGVLTAVATGSNVGVTASQAGNYKYLPATLTRQFSVFNKQTPAFVADAHFEGANGRIEFTGTATITVTGVSTGEDFTITNGDNTIISVVRDGETITITGLALGSTTLTLAQAGNDDFIAKSQTYNIEVYWPDDFLALSSSVEPTHTAGTYRKVFFNRTLKSGYNSIALPFSTDVATLTGRNNADDWVATLTAVTWNSTDGYTLFFTKGTTIEANKPYILYLAAEVVNPTWANQEVVAAEEVTVSPQQGGAKDDWSMTSNYTVGKDMNGLYGIVNTAGGLKLGGAGSTLNAFTAYITGPSTSSGVKARTSFLDFGDEGTALEKVQLVDENEVEGYYSVDGRRLERPGRGIVVVKYRDGRRQKVKF